MKQRFRTLVALGVVALLLMAWAAAAQTEARTALGKIVIQGELKGSVEGPWTWSKGVTVTAGETVLTCDTLKVWPAKGGQDFDRVEGTGNVRLRGTYTTADKAKWQVNGSAQRVAYSNATGVGTLRGKVHLQTVNLSDKSRVTVEADTFTYNRKTQEFGFERAGKQVDLLIEPAPAPTKPAGGGAAK